MTGCIFSTGKVIIQIKRLSMERAKRLKYCITYIMFEIEAYSDAIFHYFLWVKPAGPDLREGHFAAGEGLLW